LIKQTVGRYRRNHCLCADTSVSRRCRASVWSSYVSCEVDGQRDRLGR